MKVRAVIVDVYYTLLQLGPAPADAAERWEFLWEDAFADPARLTLEDFAEATRRIIEREHAAARALGVMYPEIYWPAVAREALPELTRLDAEAVDRFLFRHTQLQRTVSLAPGAGEALAELAERRVLLGIASNAQPYTLHELDAALGSVKLSRAIFDPELTFWSFAFGFSKPDAHVFRLLSARLRARGIAPGETLMVGDRPDNDLEPAQAHGWQTWRLAMDQTRGEANCGDWFELVAWLK